MSTCSPARENKQDFDIEDRVQESFDAFLDAIEATDNLEVYGTSIVTDTRIPEEVFVIRDNNKEEGIEGRYVEVSMNEIIQKVYSDSSSSAADRAYDLIRVIQNDRPGIVLNGITRIVGYYSRVNNWNKSKLGELRNRIESRADGGYLVNSKDKPVFQKEALSYVNGLGNYGFSG